MNPYKKLLGNSALFAIGNLGSKLISILLVPLYTFYLSTEEYGLIDIVTTTSSMMLPLISLSIYDATLRFIMEKNSDVEGIWSNSILVTIIGTIIVLVVSPLLSLFSIFQGILSFTIFLIVSQIWQTLIGQYTRAIGMIKEYAFNGILMTLVTSVLNIILLVYLEMGVSGYIVSLIVSNIVSILYLSLTTKLGKQISTSKFSFTVIKELLEYSVPLIPNSFMWWIMNASNRYFILLFIGASANGLFAVANKIPSLLSILYSIFIQAWQLSAIEEYDSENNTNMYSNVFDYFSSAMFLGASGILLLIRPLFLLAFQSEYYQSLKIVPFLLLGIIFSSFSSFLGANYVAAKNTKGVFLSSVLGAIISAVLNVILIPLLGVIGSGISTMLSFFIIWLYRIYDTKKDIEMTISYKKIFTNLLFITLQIIGIFLNLELINELAINFLIFLFILIANRKCFFIFFKLIKIKK